MKKRTILSWWAIFAIYNGFALGEIWLFKTRAEAEAVAASKGDRVIEATIADPSYDQTFKTIFSTEGEGMVNLMGFLNSVYFPDIPEDGVKIRKIEPLNKEQNRFGVTTHSGMLLSDIVCKCFCYAAAEALPPQTRSGKPYPSDAQAFDVEIQRSQQSKFSLRLLEYSEGLRSRYGIPAKALGLLNYPIPQGEEWRDASKSYAWCEVDPAQRVAIMPNKGEEVLMTDAIDLRRFSREIEPIININGNRLGDLGINWLRLISVCQWAEQISDPDDVLFKIYYLETTTHPYIKGAIRMLSSIDANTLAQIRNAKKGEKDALDFAEAKGEAKGEKRGREEERYRNVLQADAKGPMIMEIFEISEEELKQILQHSPAKVSKMQEDDVHNGE